MATIPVGKVKPYRKVRIEHFPEGSSQTFVAGDLLTYSATADTGHQVIKATSDTTIANLVGFAAEAASGTAGTKLAVYVGDEMGEFVANVCTVAVADDTLDNDDVGDHYGLLADVTNAAWRVDLGEVTANNKVVQIVKLLDAAGDTNGRVVFRFNKAIVASTAGYMINDVRSPF